MLHFKKALIFPVLILLLGFSVHSENSADKRFLLSKNLDIFNSIFRELDAFYVDSLNYQKLIRSGIDGMLESLDPYTDYIDQSETADLSLMTTGEYAGIGALIGGNADKIVISEPYQGKPADKAGLKAGDVLLELDGITLKGKTTTEASDMLKGEPKTIVKIKYQRPGEGKPRTIEVQREKITIDPIEYYGVIGDNTGYVLLNGFTDNAGDEMKTVLLDLKNKLHVSSIIIDLRENPGGIIDEAIKMVGFFVPKGTEVVSTRGRVKQWDRTYRTSDDPILPDMPLAILVSQGTASASEILCGALQDLDRAVVIGLRTFGKGLVQTIRPLPYDGHLKVTTYKYYIPSGRCIQAIDYSNRTNDGSPIHVADSLTHAFKTKAGRIVRDGGGIRPDIEVRNDSTINIAYYLFTQNIIFDYATQYAQKHTNIPEPEIFKLSDADYQDFKQFVKNRNFTYTLQSKKMLINLKRMVQAEGYDNVSANDITDLEEKLTPDIDKDLDVFQKDIQSMLCSEIVKRYYYQQGAVRYALLDDKPSQKALEVLHNVETYNELLHP